jgi:hypothetical protein
MNVMVSTTACFVNTFALSRWIQVPFHDLKAATFPMGIGGDGTLAYNFEVLQYISYKIV